MDLAPKYISARDTAIAKMNDLRAAMAFFLGEGDDEALGFDFVPPAPPYTGENSASVPLDLG